MPNRSVIPFARLSRLTALPLILCALACGGEEVRPAPDANAPLAPAAAAEPAEPKAPATRLGIADLVTPAGEARLTELGERELRKVHQIPPEQNLTEAGFTFADGVFVLSDNVAVLAEGLAVYYNEYEIAPYALARPRSSSRGATSHRSRSLTARSTRAGGRCSPSGHHLRGPRHGGRR